MLEYKAQHASTNVPTVTISKCVGNHYRAIVFLLCLKDKYILKTTFSCLFALLPNEESFKVYTTKMQ